MIAKYFFPGTTFKQISKISEWEKGYLVWGFKFWQWIINKGISITDYNLIDYEGWSKKGVTALQKSLSEKEFTYIKNHMKNLDVLTSDIKATIRNKDFIYKKKKPTLENLTEALAKGNPCEVVLDSHTLDRIDGFALHRVVVLDISDDIVTFHDPRLEPRPKRKEDIAHFKKAWLKAVAEPELCIYSKQ